MLYDITFEVRNDLSAKYPIIRIRRLYQVIFLHENLRELSVFTGLVFRALETNNKVRPFGEDFALKFGFKIPRKAFANLEAREQIKVVDCLNPSGSFQNFGNEEDPWHGMWAGGCKIKPNEGAFNYAFESLLPTVERAKAFGLEDCCKGPDGGELPLDKPLRPTEHPAQDLISKLHQRNAFLLRGDPGTDNLDKLSFCLPAKSSEHLSAAPAQSIDTGHRAFEYEITPTGDTPAGCDLISWTRVSIPIARDESSLRRIINRDLAFEWRFANANQRNTRRNQEFQCDQIRVYIVAPSHKRLDIESATLEREYASEAFTTAVNFPKARNALDDMVTDAKYYFSSWITEFNILSRQVYRVHGSYFEEPAKNEYWAFKLRSRVVRSRGYDAELLYTILIPIIAAFGVDHHRLEEIGAASGLFGKAGGIAIGPVFIDGRFPYLGVFSPLHTWILLLCALALQQLLYRVWRNEKHPTNAIFWLLNWVSFGVAIMWFFPIFILGLANIPKPNVAGPPIELFWMFAIVLPIISTVWALLFCSRQFHFSGFAQSARVISRNWVVTMGDNLKQLKRVVLSKLSSVKKPD